MKYALIILIALSLSSCFPVDHFPSIHLKLDKSLVRDIDSIILIDSLPYAKSRAVFGVKVYSETEDYVFLSASNSRIKIKFKNGKDYFSDPLTFEKDVTIKISRQDNKIRFEKIVKTNFQKYAPVIFIILLVILITKVPVAMSIIGPSSKLKFLLHYGGLNLIYFAIFVLLLSINDQFISLLYPFYLVVLIIDLLFLVKFYRAKNISTPIFAGIAGNLLYLTVGQLIISFALLFFI